MAGRRVTVGHFTKTHRGRLVSKYRVTFDVDLEKVGLEDATGGNDPTETVAQLVAQELLKAARLSSLASVSSARTNEHLSASEKAAIMARGLKKAKLTLQAEANLQVEQLPMDAEILDDTPERTALAA